MTEQIKQIADRIKGLREISGISAESLSKELDINLKNYLEYESGSLDIPVSFLYKIAQKLDIELSALLSGDNPKLRVYCIVRKGKGLFVEREKQYKYESLANNFVDKKVEPFMVTIDPEPEGTSANFNSHQGQEFNYIIEGSMKIIIDGHEIILNEGDSIYFDSSYNHAMKALNKKPAKLLALIL
jgi:transcriptional regulator with XRE-family HTH domain